RSPLNRRRRQPALNSHKNRRRATLAAPFEHGRGDRKAKWRLKGERLAPAAATVGSSNANETWNRRRRYSRYRGPRRLHNGAGQFGSATQLGFSSPRLSNCVYLESASTSYLPLPRADRER